MTSIQIGPVKKKTIIPLDVILKEAEERQQAMRDAANKSNIDMFSEIAQSESFLQN